MPEKWSTEVHRNIQCEKCENAESEDFENLHDHDLEENEKQEQLVSL